MIGDGRSALVAGHLRDDGSQIAAGRIAGHGQPRWVRSELARVAASGPPSGLNWKGTASSTFCRMASIAGTRTKYASRLSGLWLAAAVVGTGYGVFLIDTALRLPAGADLTGQFPGQPAVKALMAIVLAAAALLHPVVRERRWLVGALLLSAAGDFLLAMPWWEPSFVGGLGAFLLAHLCYLGALVPLVAVLRPRLVAAAVVLVACVALLVWFWPRLLSEGLTIPVVLYMAVLGAMVCAALLARLPTVWTAVGAVCFAVSDGMIGISEFVRGDQLFAVPVWWAYAAAQVLITAGFFFGRTCAAVPFDGSDDSATPAG